MISFEPVVASDMPTLPISFPVKKNVQATAAVDHVVDWLNATSTIKDLKLAPVAKRKWARVLAVFVSEILSNITDNLCRDVPRKSRVRLDVACMLAFGSYFASLPMKDVSINIWIDASPQRRSRELLASSFDLVIAQGDGAPKVERRLFRMLRLGIGLHTAVGQWAALLWQIWLVVGPDLRTRVLSCRTSCQSRRTKVRSFCWQTA